ncbi:TPA: 3'-5' exonuclease [Acinetobacter baumannii]
MNRLMLDFETLDVGECPVILSMGAVVFNETGIVDCISEKIDQQSCLDLGCTISESTLAWWKEQSEEAHKAAFGGTTNIGYAMGMLVGLLMKHECTEIWSAGSLADIRWTNNILEKLQMKKPWKFYHEMCFRTFRVFMPQIEFEKTGTAHNALDDAINQARYWIEATKQLKTILFQGMDLALIDDKDISIAVHFDENGKMSFYPVEGEKA